MEENIFIDDSSKNLLEKIYQSLRSNVYVINYAISKTINENFKKQLEKNRDSFLKLINDCLAFSSSLNTNILDINVIKKAKLKAKIKFNMIFDDSTENVAKTILTFMNEEIFKTIKDIDCNPNCLTEIRNLALSYNKTIEKNICDTKKYLLKDPTKFDEITQKKKENTTQTKKQKKNKNKK